MTKGVFITATDTGVGKTIASAMLIRALIRKGINAGAMKPFETGCIRQGSNLFPSDGVFLKQMAGMDDPVDSIAPVRFELPLAPLVASRLEKRVVNIENIFKSYEHLGKKYDFMVVEGAGGILVPVLSQEGVSGSSALFIADIIKLLNIPLIVVSRPTLGTINHTLLTVKYALNAGLKVIGVIINYNNPPGVDISEKTNPDIITELCPAPVIGILPYAHTLTKEYFDMVVSHSCKDMFDSIIGKIIDINE